MGLLNKILNKTTGEAVNEVSNLLDKIITSDDDRLLAKNELSRIITEKLTEFAQLQRDVLVNEMQGNLLQRNWRPIVMLMFSFIVVYSKFIAPAFSLPNTELEPYFWELLEIGIGGYVIGRTIEKVTGKVTDNIDISFIKRKNRKI